MTIRIRNTNALSLSATADWASLPTHVVLRVGGVGLDSVAIDWTNDPDPSSPPVNGQSIDFAARTLVFTLTNSNYNEAALLPILQAGNDEVAYTASLHSGDPGAGFNANEIAVATNRGYARYNVTCEIV